MRAGERGASGLFILVILILVALGVLATVALNRQSDATAERQNTTSSLAKALAALDAFAAASARLPCPADPALDTGIEAVVAGAATCDKPQGTLPWNSLGMRRDDAYDSWGHKISYRVYTGPAGSLTQPGGASMVDCDTVEAFPGGTTAVVGSSGGLCRTDHTTTPAQFLAGKGLTVTDFGTVHNDVAYVVISHGVTGLGSYTTSGVQLPDQPKTEELANTQATGPFTLEAFSDSNTSATSNGHFDDLLAYRTISDLVKVANLSARDWPDDVLSSVTFDQNALTSALGSNPHSDSGTTTISFPNLTVSAFNSGGAENISYVHGGGVNDGIGGVNGGTNLLTSGGEGLQLTFASDAQQFAFTLDNFNSTGSSNEQVELRFYKVVGNTATLQGSPVTKASCASDTLSESFSVNPVPSVTFNRVEIRPVTATGGSASDFSLSEERTCTSSVTCQTMLASSGSGHACP